MLTDRLASPYPSPQMLTDPLVFNEVRRLLGAICSWHGHWATTLGALRITHAPLHQSLQQDDSDGAVHIIGVLRSVDVLAPVVTRSTACVAHQLPTHPSRRITPAAARRTPLVCCWARRPQ